MEENFIVECRFCGTKNKLDKEKSINRLKLVVCGSCRKKLFFGDDENFSNISSASYEHPLDKQALAKLKRIPGVNTFLKWLMKETNERYMRMFQFQNFIRVTESHLPKYHDMLRQACSILDIKSLPQTFIYQDPQPNAFTIGVDEPTISISTGLIDLMDDDEVLGVITHELGHIQCGHILYKTAARVIGYLADYLSKMLLGLGNIAIYPIMYALLYWDRCSELTADRAELIVLRDFNKTAKIIMKLAGGSQKILNMINTEQFLKQADEASKMKEENFLNKVFVIMQTMDKSHPFPLWRAGHLHKWAKSDEYINIIQGNYESEK
jgi:Zn-dependent protease with chaperone function